MRVPGLRTARQVARQIRSRLFGRAIILGYHRVAVGDQDYLSLAVSPQNFAEHLQVIREVATPISLSQVEQALHGKDLPRNAVTVTLDDGYADNLYAARPVLERFEIPATIFVTSGYLGREFWWDELVRRMFTSSAPTSEFCLTISGRKVEWKPKAERETGEQRKELYDTFYWALRPLPEDERQKAMQALRRWTDDVHESDGWPRALTFHELVSLSTCTLIEIGSHTHTHPVLATMSYNEQHHEILHSKQRLEEIAGRLITGFSFPNGSYSPITQGILKNEKFKYACCSNEDTVWKKSQRYQLPRLWVPDINGEVFERWLRRWLRV